MDWPENLLILLGISLDIFAGMECKGSLLAKIEKKQLVLACAVVSVWQAAALFAGNFLSTLLLKKDGIAENEMFIGSVIAVAIFVCLGVRLMSKAIKNEAVQERREAGIKVTNYKSCRVLYIIDRNRFWICGDKTYRYGNHDGSFFRAGGNRRIVYRISFRLPAKKQGIYCRGGIIVAGRG